jgi:hypothetical protein
VGAHLVVAVAELGVQLLVVLAALVPALAMLMLATVGAIASWLFGRRGRAMRASITETTFARLRTVLGPLRALRGRSARSDVSQRIGLRPDPTPLEIDPSGIVLEGTVLEESGSVALASDLEGTIVGVEGVTLNAHVGDALVAPLRVRTDAGEIVCVKLEVGEVWLSHDGRELSLGDGLPPEWGVARRPRRGRVRRRFPAPTPVMAWAVPVGTRIRVEGGVLAEEPFVSATDSYRSQAFGKVLRGLEATPIRLTVLPAGESAQPH